MYKVVVFYDIVQKICTGGPRLVRFLGPGKNRTMRNWY